MFGIICHTISLSALRPSNPQNGGHRRKKKQECRVRLAEPERLKYIPNEIDHMYFTSKLQCWGHIDYGTLWEECVTATKLVFLKSYEMVTVELSTTLSFTRVQKWCFLLRDTCKRIDYFLGSRTKTTVWARNNLKMIKAIRAWEAIFELPSYKQYHQPGGASGRCKKRIDKSFQLTRRNCWQV